MSDRNVKKKQGLKFVESFDRNDFFTLRKNISGDERWARLGDFIDDVLSEVVVPTSTESSVEIDYDGTDVNAVWIFGNYSGLITCANPSLTHSGVAKWHFSRLDSHGVNLDTAYNGNSLFDKIVDATDGAIVIIKIYNRQDPTQYIYLETETPISKQNPTPSGTIYYDLELDAQVISHSGIEANSIQNPSVTFLIGRSIDVVRNNTDDFTSVEKVKNVISLTDAEYAAIVTKDANTLYIVPSDGCEQPITIGVLGGGEYVEKEISKQLVFELSGIVALEYYLPLIGEIENKTFFVNLKNVSESDSVVIYPSGSDTINGTTSITIGIGEYIRLYINETDWSVI